ncbi:Salicylate carboxymethyltransferase, partial [Cucurbita argyrosperma subsp. sororia]
MEGYPFPKTYLISLRRDLKPTLFVCSVINDFNSLFKSLPSFHQNLKTHIGNHDLGPCFFTGVPGSFYNRLFPRATLHFVHSSYSLHWLSQVPEGLESNKGNIFISDTSPKAVQEACHSQFQKDFSTFTKCRAEELVVGGSHAWF